MEVVEGADSGRQIMLSSSLEAGREPSLEITLDDRKVSRRHLRLEPTASGAAVEDLGSTNGTYVNDQPIHARRTLVPGDRVRLGLTVLELRTDEQLAAEGSAVASRPELTDAGDALRPAPESELAAPVALRAEQQAPAFVPENGPQGRVDDVQALARLVDSRVKHQTNVAVFALLSGAGLAVLIFLGAR